jgi:hypothetical protein
MGEYANPTGYVDTQTGQHFRDLTANIANIVGKTSTDYIAKMKANAKEVEEGRKKEIEDKNKIDQAKEDFNNKVGNVNKENLPVNFRPSFDPVLNEAVSLEGLVIKGTATNDERDKLLKAKATPTKVSTMFGQASAFGESFLKAYVLPTGTEGSLSLFTPEDIKVPLAILTKQQQGLKTSVPITYNEDLRDYETSIEVVDSNGKPYSLTGQKLNDRSTDGGDLHYSIPVLFKKNDEYKVAKKDFWEAFTTENGKKNYTGSLKKDFIKQDFTGKAPNGMNFSKGEAYIDIPGDKTNGVVTQTTRKFYNIYDIDKLANDTWVEDQKVSFAESVAQSPMSPKIAWFETLLPRLNQLNNSKDASEEDKKTISALIKEFGGKSFEDERKEGKNPTEDQIKAAQNAYIFLAKQDLKDQYQYRPVLNEDGTEKTQTLNTSSKTSSNNGGGDGGGSKNDNIILANDPTTVTNNLKKLKENKVAEIKMYLNIGGETNEYTVMHSPKDKGYIIYKSDADEGLPIYGETLEEAAADAVRSLSKAQKASQELYNKRKKNKK